MALYFHLFKSIKKFRSIPITSPQSFPDEEVLLIKEGKKKIIDWVWNKYKDFTGVDLSNITHEKDSPWRKIAEKHNFKVLRGMKMPRDVVKEYYRAI